jgi:hypothetical protein
MVLRHLRGFPDELHRFSNVVKQAHGRSAVELFLSRPAAGDSFLAALCRAARDGQDVVTVVEAAELLHRPAANLLTADAEAALPPAWWGTGRHRLWHRADRSGEQRQRVGHRRAAPRSHGPLRRLRPRI